jgi:hypothetical protein
MLRRSTDCEDGSAVFSDNEFYKPTLNFGQAGKAISTRTSAQYPLAPEIHRQDVIARRVLHREAATSGDCPEGNRVQPLSTCSFATYGQSRITFNCFRPRRCYLGRFESCSSSSASIENGSGLHSHEPYPSAIKIVSIAQQMKHEQTHLGSRPSLQTI